MSMLSGYLITSVERITAPTGVRRVERDPGADEFNRRQQEAQDGKRSPHDETEDEIPEDVVDVSVSPGFRVVPRAPRRAAY
jgi:hypothetical protein